MFQVTCPFCYHRINWQRLPLVCSGKNAPGYPRCEQRVDQLRRTEAKSEEPMYPVFSPRPPWLPTPRQARCPHCRGTTGAHACPACHTPLPPDFGGGFSPVIALIGATRTGKTVYLTVGAHHLRTVLSDRFAADVTLYPDAAHRWVNENVDAIFVRGKLPELTEQRDGRSEPLVFQWRRPSGRVLKRFRSSYLSFMDTAGESLGTLRGVAGLDFLSSVDAFILLLDPFTLPEAEAHLVPPEAAGTTAADAFTVLTQVTYAVRNAEGVRRRSKSKKPIAVAFAKIDTFRPELDEDHPIFAAEATRPWHDERASRNVHDSMRELLRTWGGRNIDDHMDANYKNYRYFALSSLGRPPDYETFTVAKGGVSPMRVADPLVWLLSWYNVVPRRRGGH